MSGNFDSTSDDPCGPGSDCYEIHDIVEKYIDGCCDEQEKVIVTSHASGCPDCKDGIAFEEKFRDRIKSIQPECMPEELKNKIMMSYGFPGMTELPASLGGQDHHAKHSFFKFFRKNTRAGGDFTSRDD